MDHLTEQDAGLLEQAASMLEGLANDERNRGNCSSSEGAACSAHAIRRLAPAMLRAGRGCLAQIEEPAGAAPAAVAPQGERQWICPTRTVADLVNNLLTMDQALPIYGVQYIERDGRRCAIAVPPTVSRERVKDGRWIGGGEELNAAVVWTRAEQPAAVAGPAREEIAALREEHGITSTGRGIKEFEQVDAFVRAVLQRWGAAPALEAPAAPSGEGSLPSSFDVRRALQFIHDTFKKDLDAGYRSKDKEFAVSIAAPALAAAPQAPAQEAPAALPVPADEFRGDTPSLVRNIVALLELDADGALVPHGVGGHARGLLSAAAARLAAAPQAPAAPVDDLAQLVKQLVRALRKALPGNDLADKALDYLKRQGLQGSPLRATPEAPQTHAGLLAAAAHIQAKAQAHLDERGSYDPDTGAVEMSESNQEHFNTLDELAEELRELADKSAQAACDKPPAGWTCSRAPGHDGPCAAAPAAPAAPAVDARGERDAAFEAVRKRLCGLQRYSFVLDDDGVVRRAQDRTGNWIEFDDAHALFDPVAVDAARAAQAKEGGESA